MKTEYRALIYRHQAHLTRPTDAAHIRAKVDAVLDGDHIGEEILGTFASVADAIACAKQPDVSPVITDAWAFGKMLLWESTEVVRIDIDEDGEEDWGDGDLLVQYPTPEELVAFVLDKFATEEDEEDE